MKKGLGALGPQPFKVVVVILMANLADTRTSAGCDLINVVLTELSESYEPPLSGLNARRIDDLALTLPRAP